MVRELVGKMVTKLIQMIGINSSSAILLMKGNTLIVKCKYRDKTFLIAAIYGPNNDNPLFFHSLCDKLESYGEMLYLITGDFNVTINRDRDNTNYRTNSKTRVMQGTC